MIEAAGGVVWRVVGDETQILLIHRPKYGDWSLPKGKLDPGEEASAGALREVREETGLQCTLGPKLPRTLYFDRHRRRKRVQYWAMQVQSGRFEVNSEVDETRWLTINEAVGLLTYRRDRRVVLALRSAAGIAA